MNIVFLDIAVTFIPFPVENFFRTFYKVRKSYLRRAENIGSKAIHMSTVFRRPGYRSVMFATAEPRRNGKRIS